VHLCACPLQNHAQLKRDEDLLLHHEDGLSFEIGAIHGCGPPSRL
jgi:hypothetical protein